MKHHTNNFEKSMKLVFNFIYLKFENNKNLLLEIFKRILSNKNTEDKQIIHLEQLELYLRSNFQII